MAETTLGDFSPPVASGEHARDPFAEWDGLRHQLQSLQPAGGSDRLALGFLADEDHGRGDAVAGVTADTTTVGDGILAPDSDRVSTLRAGASPNLIGKARGAVDAFARQLQSFGEQIPVGRNADLARIIDSPLASEERQAALRNFGELILVRPDGDLEIPYVGDLLRRIGERFMNQQAGVGSEIGNEIAVGMEYMRAIHNDVLPHLLGYTRFEAMPVDVQDAFRAFTEELALSYSTSPHGNKRLRTLYAGLQQRITLDQKGQLRGIHRAGEFISIHVHNTLGHFLHRYTSEVVNRPHFLSKSAEVGNYGHSFFPQLKDNAYLRGELPTQRLSENPPSPRLSVTELSDKLVGGRMETQDGQRKQLEREISRVSDFVAGRIELAIAPYLRSSTSAPMTQEIAWLHNVLSGKEYVVTDGEGGHTEKAAFEADQRGVLGYSVREGIGLHTARPVRLLDVKRALRESPIDQQASNYADRLATHFVILRHRGQQKKMAVLVPWQYASEENLATLRQEFPNVTFIDGHMDPSTDITRFAAQGYEYRGGGEGGEFEVARAEGLDSFTIADGDVGVIGMCGNTEGTTRKWVARSPRYAGSLAAATWAKELLAEPARDVEGVQARLRQAKRRTNRNWREYVASLSKEEQAALDGARPTATIAHVVGEGDQRAAVISKQGDGQVFVIREGVVRRITFDSAVTEDFYRGRITREEQVEIQEALDRIVTRKDLNEVMLEIAKRHMQQELEAQGATDAEMQEMRRKFDFASSQLSVYEDYGSPEHVRAFDFLTPELREDGKGRTKWQVKRAREEMRREYLGYLPPHMRRLAEYYNARNAARVTGHLHAEEYIVPVEVGDELIIAAAGTPPAAIVSAVAARQDGSLQDIVRAAGRVSGPWSGGVVDMRVA